MALIQHAWAGEPHNSESVKYVDGVEVARNSATPFNAKSTSVGIYAETEYPLPGETRVTSTFESTSSVLPRIQRVTEFSVIPDVIPGQSFAIAAHVKHERSLPVYIRAWFLDADFNRAGNQVDAEPHIGTEYGLSFTSGEVPSNAIRLGMQLLVDSSTDLGPSLVGDIFWAKNFHIALADSLPEVQNQVLDYFDGDTPDYYDTATAKMFLDNAWVEFRSNNVLSFQSGV